MGGIKIVTRKAIDLATFCDMPYNKQLHYCCQQWQRANHESLYKNGRVTPSYFKCRAYLMRLPRQSIKNIAIMLTRRPSACSIYDLEKMANDYLKEEQTQEAERVQKESKSAGEYDIDLLGFLSGGV